MLRVLSVIGTNMDHLPSFVSSVATIFTTAFPDVMFTGKAGKRPLVVNVPKCSARYIRLRLPQPGMLHLHSIEISASRSDGLMFLPQMATLETSSVYRSTSELVREKCFLLPVKGQRYGFHTAKDLAPSATIDLGANFVLNRLIVWNREDGFHDRAIGLIVETSVDRESWSVHYDGAARARLLKSCISQIQASLDGSGNPSTLDCVSFKIFSLLLCGDRKGAEIALSTSSMPQSDKAKVKKDLNDYLRSRKLEWNIHGIRKTFRFWNSKEKTEYLNFCNDVCKSLLAVSQDLCIGFGSVLSLVRDRDLIPHDDDLDIILSFPKKKVSTITEALSLIEVHLQNKGFSVGGMQLKTHRQISIKGGKSIDVFVGLEEDGFVSWYPQQRGVLRHDDVFPAMRASLLGVEMSIPRNPFRYLESVYGKSWHIPDSGWRHNWDISAYADIL